MTVPASIKDVAKQAGVSIATVSHVINKTRYVSPELVQKVEDTIKKIGYVAKNADTNHKQQLRMGRLSEIAFVVPHINGGIYVKLADALTVQLARRGFTLSLYVTQDDPQIESHILLGLLSNRRIAGIIIAPVSDNAENYMELLTANLPVLCLERSFQSDKVHSFLAENERAIYMGATHLVESGHEKIAILLENPNASAEKECLQGYRRALSDHNIVFDPHYVRYFKPHSESASNSVLTDLVVDMPTAFITSGNRLTLELLHSLESMGLEYPKDVSVIGFGCDEWCELAAVSLTTIQQDVFRMGYLAAEKMLHLIQGSDKKPCIERVPTTLSIRKSTQMIGRGPFGEKAVSPEDVLLSDAEIQKLRSGNFTVCISFHYCGTEWARLHEKGIRDKLDLFGVKIMSVADAHFDPLMQVTQLEGLCMQNPDVIIAVPTDDKVTSKKFKEISQNTKLVFISNVPEGLEKNDYCSCVSVNERENGKNAGILLGEHFRSRDHVKVGFLSHGTPFYGTHLRDMVAAEVITEHYPNVQIVDNRDFFHIGQAYETCKQMLLTHPDIEGLYISWDRPALEAIRAIKELDRQDISIITFDLDFEIATYLASGLMVRGLSTQRPYEQGEAVALAVAKALLGNTSYKYIGVAPYTVTPKNLMRAWRDIVHTPVPEALETISSSNLRKK